MTRLQERFESSEIGRTVISGFLIVTLIMLVAVNIPDSKLRRDLLKAGQPFLNATGLDQIWSVFAPDPRRTSVELYARVKYADGSAGIWHMPKGNALLGEYWDYRWRKWLENVIQDARKEQLWGPAVAYVARQERERGRDPVKVTLVRRWQDLFPPGTHPDRSPWHQYAFYSKKVTPANPRGR